MKKITLSILSAALIFTACKKDSSTTSSAIDGTWNFAGMSAQTQSTSTTTSGSDVYKGVATLAYTTTGNSGTINFGNNTATSTNLAYSFSSIAHYYEYTNGTLTDSTSLPISSSIPASSGVSQYQIVGTDSIYFPSGFVSIGGTTTASQAGGAKFSISGNTLTMNMTFSRDSTFAGGDVLESGTAVITLQH